MTASMLKFDHIHNPLDIAEMVMLERDLAFDRSGDADLLAESTSMWGAQRIWFSWQEEHRSLSLSSTLENKIAKASLSRVYELLAFVNERLWLGHFSIDSDSSAVMFRHTLLVNAHDGQLPSQESIDDLIDLATQEWDRFFPALQSVVWGGKQPREALEFAMFETVAEA